MSLVAISGNASGTGTLTIAAPNTNSNRTLTLPDGTGTFNISGVVNEVPAGTVSAPSIYPTGDTNTGIFFPAADTIAFSEGGAEVARFDNSGNFGIGTSSPAEKLDVSGNIRLTGADTSIKFVNAGGYDFSIRANAGNALEFYSPEFSANALMSLSNGGNLLVGTSATALGNIGCQMFPTGYYQATCNAAPAMILKRGSNDGAILDFYDSAGNRRGYVNVTTSATTYNTISDYRLKENVIPMTDALAKVQALKPVTYTWKANGSSGQGFIAHELQSVIPDCVVGQKDATDADGNPDYQGIDTSFLVATLTAAIQEQQALIIQLQADVAELKGATP
jgi:hypothetical protein